MRIRFLMVATAVALVASIALAGPSVANGNGVGGGGSVVVNISAIDSQDVKRFFHSNGNLLVSALNRATRNGSLLRTV